MIQPPTAASDTNACASGQRTLDASVEAGVRSVPTFHFIKNSELVAEFSGADHVKLRALIKQHA